MNPARGLANQKLYHAAILQRMLAAELAREEIPQTVLLEAVGESVRLQLLEAYGWFLLELADIQPLPSQPPASVSQLQQHWELTEPLRGELIELQALEATQGWLSELQASPAAPASLTPRVTASLAVAAPEWSSQQLAGWHSGLSGLIDRMSHSLDEW
ncbi:MAG: hypothetical protein ABJ308_13430 [Halieaceae bacterium]